MKTLPRSGKFIKKFLGTWQVVAFEISGMLNSAIETKTFSFRNNGTYEESNLNQNNFVLIKVKKHWRIDADAVKLYTDGKLNWIVRDINKNSLVLASRSNNLTYYCRRDRPDS